MKALVKEGPYYINNKIKQIYVFISVIGNIKNKKIFFFKEKGGALCEKKKFLEGINFLTKG